MNVGHLFSLTLSERIIERNFLATKVSRNDVGLGRYPGASLVLIVALPGVAHLHTNEVAPAMTTTCLNFAARQHNDSGNMFVTRSKSVSMISKGWKRLQMTCKKGGSSLTGSLEDRSSSAEQYVMLEDDEYEEGAVAYKPTGAFPIDDIQDIRFIPQWSRTMVEPQPETARDTCSLSSSDTDSNVDNRDVGRSMDKPTLDELIGTFDQSLEKPCDTRTTIDAPSIIVEDIEEICGVSFLRPGDRNRRKKYRSKIMKSISTGRAVDSETEEDSSSLSSIPDECVSKKSSGSKWIKQATSNNKQRRSIRFSDEVLGQSLTTIHIVPWSEHEDVNWIPRPVKCRIEL